MTFHSFSPTDHASNVDNLHREVQEIEVLRNKLYELNREADIGKPINNDVEDLYDEIRRQFNRAVCSTILINAGFDDSEVEGFFDGVRLSSITLDNTKENRSVVGKSKYLKLGDTDDDSITCGVLVQEYIEDNY